MKTTLNTAEVFASTGGREFNASGDVIMFVHGSGQSHLGYMLQGRYFANRGWDVLVPDMPAHGLSGGAPLTSIEDMADWHVALMDQLGVKSAHVVGHSQGGLIALEMARRSGDRVRGLSLVGCALAIPVNDMLLGLARDKEPAAINAMVDWGHGPVGHAHDHTMPGQSHLYYGRQLMEANETGALFADLSACAAYSTGADAAAALSCPAQAILGQRDKMTPLKFGLQMAKAIGDETPTVIPNAGHMLPNEHPVEVNRALRTFFEAQK
ncbi:alpha/beta hydrolase [Amylibacter marinus]|uniref:Alpha/beta hydrolase n=1 Tax=Amylibacter marinus TaxID=1475483 RepID=A0ABQ5VUH5_9RHOB|nr:alpha/beta hydrolase [Amylibacter marinus]GLQ34980.1 alpha/beta hydrolase [Amylibacter marinus]